MIEYQCPHCANVLQIPEQYAGKTGTCAKCKASITVPESWIQEENSNAANQRPVISTSENAERHYQERDDTQYARYDPNMWTPKWAIAAASFFKTRGVFYLIAIPLILCLGRVAVT